MTPFRLMMDSLFLIPTTYFVGLWWYFHIGEATVLFLSGTFSWIYGVALLSLMAVIVAWIDMADRALFLFEEDMV